MIDIKTDILVNRRKYYVDNVKAPLLMAVIIYGYRYPEPKRETCKNPDSLVLLDIWDEFFQLEDNPGRDRFFKALRRISIGELEANDYYSQRFTWFLMKLVGAYMDGRWQPNLACSPFACWKDPETIAAKEQAIEDLITTMSKGVKV